MFGIGEKMKMQTRQRPSWDEYFILIAKAVASRSTCLSRQLGVVIVGQSGATKNQILSTGYSGALPGVQSCLDDGECYYRSNNLSKSTCRSNHAEANAIEMAARAGISLYKSKMYMMLSPCYKCAKQIIMAGINEVIWISEHKVLDKLNEDVLAVLHSSKIKTRTIMFDCFAFNDFMVSDTQNRQLPEHEDLITKGQKDGHT